MCRSCGAFAAASWFAYKSAGDPSRGDDLVADLDLNGAVAARRSHEILAMRQRLADGERALGPDHPELLLSRNKVAAAHESIGELDSAHPLLEQTLTESKRVLGADHPVTFASLNSLAVAIRAAGRQSAPLKC